MTSSAGWKINRTRPGKPRRGGISALAAPSTVVRCRSCPHAWLTPGTVEAKGQVGVLGQRQRVDVGPQRRSPAPPHPTSATTPVPVGSSSAAIPAPLSSASSRSEVVVSVRASSGWACTRRRTRDQVTARPDGQVGVEPVGTAPGPQVHRDLGISGTSPSPATSGTAARPSTISTSARIRTTPR